MNDRIKTLESLIDEAPSALEKIDAMNELAWEIRDNQTQKAEHLSQDALELAKRGGEDGKPYQKGIADSLRNLGVINQRFSNYQFALTSAQEALSLYQSLGLPKGEAETLRIISNMYFHLGNNPVGLDHCLQSIVINEEIGNKKGLARTLNTLGSIYSSIGDFDKTRDTFEQALEIHKECNDYLGEATSYNNIAMAYYFLEEYDQALKYSKKSLRLAKSKGIAIVMVNAVCTVGEIYLEMGDNNSAKDYFQESLTLSREIEFRFIELHSLYNLGKIRFISEDYETARDLLRQALLIAEETQEKQMVFECHKLLGEINKKTDDYETALFHVEKFLQVREEIFNSQAEVKFRNLEILHQAKTAQREKEVKQARESEFQVLFEESPISIWELDMSELKSFIEELKKSGVADFDAYFNERPEEISTWVALIKIINVNKKTVELFKAMGKETILEEFQPFIHRDAVKVFQSIFAKFAHGEQTIEARLPTFTYEGDKIFTENLFTIAQGHEDSWSKVLCSVIDVTEEEGAKQNLKESEELYRSVSEMANDGIGIMEEGIITFCNSSFAKIIGREIDEVLGQPYSAFLHPDSLPEVIEDYQNILAGEEITPRREFTAVKKDGSIITIEVSGSVLEGPPNLRVLMIGRDITEQKSLEDQLHQLATTDPLTGISNRRHFIDTAEQELDRSKRYGHQMGLIMFDIDHFKKINDSYGHVVGDEALKQLTSMCQSDLRSIDLLARLGGEEFVVLLPEMAKEGALLAAERIRSKLSKKTYKIEGNKFKMTVSLGVTSLSLEDKSITLDHLLDQADKALYQSKQGGRNKATVWEESKVDEI